MPRKRKRKRTERFADLVAGRKVRKIRERRKRTVGERIGARISEARIEAGLSMVQVERASFGHVARVSLSANELGHVPSVLQFVLIASALGVSLESLLPPDLAGLLSGKLTADRIEAAVAERDQ